MPPVFAVLLLAAALIGVGLLVNRSRIRRWVARRQAARVGGQIEELGRETRLVLLGDEFDRLRRKADTDEQRLRLAEMLRLSAVDHQLNGRLAEALTCAEEAADITDELSGKHPRQAIWPHLTLGQALAAIGDDDVAAVAVRKAFDLAQAYHLPGLDRAMLAANLSMILRRLGRADEAAKLATWAVTVGQQAETAEAPPFTVAAMGWAQAALALAQTDTGQDGRPAADEAVAIWNSLVAAGVFPDGESEGQAYADFVAAYALRPFDPALAQEKAQRVLLHFEQLSAQVPRRYDRRLVEVDAFLRSPAPAAI
ncbi:tetratricopeptide (TPR) repeat protein [Allocatelliglobosispora scoriae]|uniref:Tetratricopeptide (TPR) repeat protein n=1 Tax=Allocatelliglobosispora scoriae TaxID=643052 RepID=A0A841BK04_9ACTN|nr:tetratricopeptide repeat protein [Allocatelliglobosispora scoriae]MBB5867102.1 tetratricopeptide (TPR) repeat protein [Allocatelliglobosispora scoriae]